MENKVWFKIDSRNLVYGGEWDDAKLTIRAKVFGVMVELAKDRIEYYRSDLYHDALWINEYLIGPMSFDWVARESGTHIGEVVQHVKDSDCVNSARYRFDIRVEEDRKWMLDIYQSVPVTNLPADIDYSENEAYQLQLEKDEKDLGAKYRDKMQEEFVLPDEFHPYFSNEPLPESVVESVANQDVNPINDMIDMLFAKPIASQEQSWADRHAALDINECDVAFTAAGCIFHPAPVNGWTNEHVTVQENPTPRNETTRKENAMDSVREMLEEKLSDLNQKLEELEDAEREIEDAKDIAQRNIDALEEALNSLDLSLEDFYISVDVSYSE